MKTLLLMRHAKSSRDNPGLDDHARPLNKRGQKTAPLMGRLLKEKSLIPDLIISSSALRAQETARLVVQECAYQGKIETTAQIYEAGPQAYFEVLKATDDKFRTVLIMGHNPGMESLLEKLTGRFENFSTAAIAQLELSIAHWKDFNPSLKAKMVNLWRPKEFK